jgi:hypothetical protein
MNSGRNAVFDGFERIALCRDRKIRRKGAGSSNVVGIFFESAPGGKRQPQAVFRYSL